MGCEMIVIACSSVSYHALFAAAVRWRMRSKDLLSREFVSTCVYIWGTTFLLSGDDDDYI
jgi:hypothetical protein